MSIRNIQQSDTTRTKTLREVLAIGMSFEAGKRDDPADRGPGSESGDPDGDEPEIDLVELEWLARKELELELSDKVLDHQNRMLLLYPKVKALMPEGENWMGLLFNVLVVEDPVTEKTAPDLLLVILESMATLLDARREVANFKEITAALQIIVGNNASLLSHDSNVSHTPDGVHGGTITNDLARKLDQNSAAFPHTYDEFFARVTLCEILLNKLLDNHQQDDDTESIPEELL